MVPIGVNIHQRGDFTAMSNDDNAVFFADRFQDLRNMSTDIIDYLLEGKFTNARPFTLPVSSTTYWKVS